MYYYKLPSDIGTDDAPYPTSPWKNSNTTIFWGLSRRIDNTEKQTKELSTQSERQIRLIQAITKSQNQHELEQREAMSSLLSRIEQNETKISKLHHSTQTLHLNQRQMQQDVRMLREELFALKEQFQAQHQQQHSTVLRRVTSPTTQVTQAEQTSRKPDESTVAQPGTIFKDVYGRSELPTPCSI